MKRWQKGKTCERVINHYKRVCKRKKSAVAWATIYFPSISKQTMFKEEKVERLGEKQGMKKKESYQKQKEGKIERKNSYKEE